MVGAVHLLHINGNKPNIKSSAKASQERENRENVRERKKEKGCRWQQPRLPCAAAAKGSDGCVKHGS